MKHVQVIATLFLLLVTGPVIGFAQDAPGYLNIEYLGGHPGFKERHTMGKLLLEEEMLVFCGEPNQCFEIPYTAIASYKGTQRGGIAPGLFVAGPNPIALASSTALSAVSFAGSKLLNRPGGHRLVIKYRDPERSKLQSVQFMLPDEFIQRQVVGDLSLHIHQTR